MAQPNSANNELLHRAICFSDRVPVITGTGEIRIRESDPTVRTIAQDVAWRGLAVDAEEGRAQGELAEVNWLTCSGS